VEDLIRAANLAERVKAPWLRSEPFPNDALAVATLEAAGYALASVPDEGRQVPLRPIESTLWGGESEDQTARLHPDNAALALRAASLFGLEVAGIDLITPDAATPWHANGAVINEVNFAPVLGDGPVSEHYIPSFIRGALADDGRIPVEVFVGREKGMAVARQRWRVWADQGLRPFLSSHQETIDSWGMNMSFPFQGLFRRCRALLVDRRVDVLILVVQTDEWLDTGLPVDRFSRMTSMEFELTSWRPPGRLVPKGRVDDLLRFIASAASPQS
jgi:cyanophycin synthetase